MHEGREAGTFKGRQMLSNTLSSRAAVLGMSMPTPASALPDLRGSAAPPAASSPKRPTSSSCSDARLWCTQASMSPRYLRGSWACISMGRGMPPGPPRVRAAMILRTVAALHSPGWTIAAPDPSRPPASGSGLRPGAGKDFCQLACCSVRRRLLSAVPVIAIRKWVSWADDLHDAQAQRLHLWNRALCRVVATSIAQYLNRTGRSLRAWDACCSSGDTSGASISPRSRHLLCTHLHGGRRVLLTLVKSVCHGACSEMHAGRLYLHSRSYAASWCADMASINSKPARWWCVRRSALQFEWMLRTLSKAEKKASPMSGACTKKYIVSTGGSWWALTPSRPGGCCAPAGLPPLKQTAGTAPKIAAPAECVSGWLQAPSAVFQCQSEGQRLTHGHPTPPAGRVGSLLPSHPDLVGPSPAPGGSPPAVNVPCRSSWAANLELRV